MSNNIDQAEQDGFPENTDPEDILHELDWCWRNTNTLIAGNIALLAELYKSDDELVERLSIILNSVDRFDDYMQKVREHIAK